MNAGTGMSIHIRQSISAVSAFILLSVMLRFSIVKAFHQHAELDGIVYTCDEETTSVDRSPCAICIYFLSVFLREENCPFLVESTILQSRHIFAVRKKAFLLCSYFLLRSPPVF